MSTYQLSSLFFSNNDNDETTTESISASTTTTTTTATFLWLTNDIVNPSTLNPLLLSSSSSSSFKFNQTFQQQQQQQLQNYQHHHQNRYQNNQNYNLLECQEQFFDIENFTDLNFPGERFETKAFGLDEYFKITIYIIAIIASIFGNSAVVLSVLMKRSLRVTVNLYLANLAVADILICICCMWVHLINHLTAPTYVLGPFFCKINSFAQMTCLTSSVLSLSAIACDRYMAIMYPLRTRVTKQRTGIVITCIWIVSLIISIPFYYSRRYETVKWVDYTQTTCMEDWPYTMTYSENDGVCYKKHTMKTFYYTLVTTTLFFVPVLIMITAYSAIILILWGNRLPGEANESNLRHQKKSKRKVIKMVVVVLLVFVICWLPLQLIVLYSIYFHSSNEMLPSWFGNLIFYSYFIAYSNSVFNPIIYGGFNRNFRDALYKNAFCQSLWCFNHNNNNRNDIGGNGIGTGVGGGTRKWHQPHSSLSTTIVTTVQQTATTTIPNRNGICKFLSNNNHLNKCSSSSTTTTKTMNNNQNDKIMMKKRKKNHHYIKMSTLTTCLNDDNDNDNDNHTDDDDDYDDDDDDMNSNIDKRQQQQIIKDSIVELIDQNNDLYGLETMKTSFV